MGKIRSEKEIRGELERLKERGSPRYSCNMQYEYAGAKETLEWVLGESKHPSLAGQR